ncbi:MAG: hypothetical protein ACWGQW_24290, partial [bacterium]
MTRKTLYLLLFLSPVVGVALPAPVTFTHSTLEVPTYTFGRSQDVAPLFQIGNSKGAYPYAALDRESLSPEPVLVEYESLTIENEYLRVVILPELGGR